MAQDMFYPYCEIYEEKEKNSTQMKITVFMKRLTPPVALPAVSDDIIDDSQPSTRG